MNNLKQLEKEILKLRIAIEKETNKEIRKILSKQKKELENIRALIGSLYMKYADDEGQLVINTVDRFNEMEKVENNIINTRNILANTAITVTGATLLKGYVDSYYKTANIIDKGVSININYKLLRKEFVEAVINAQFEKMTYSDRIWNNTNKLANKLYDTIGRGITEGTSIQKLSKEVKDAFGVNSFQSTRLVRNEMARVVSQAQDQIYHDNSDIIQELLFVATLDNRTSDICQNLDTNRYKLTDDYPKIPEDTHIQCRSCYVPIVKNWNPRRRRDNITKQNIEYKSYEDWKKDNNTG